MSKRQLIKRINENGYRTNSPDILGDIVALILLVGIVMIGGSMTVLAIGSVISPSWMPVGLSMTVPFIIVGFVLVFVSVKVLEAWK